MYIGSVEEQTCPAWVLAAGGGGAEAEEKCNGGGDEEDVGSVKSSVKGSDVAGAERMELRDCKYVPALYKIFDEILVNAIDHTTRVKRLRDADAAVCPVKKICVDINRTTGVVAITNDGEGLPIDQGEHGCYVPELIFGHLLTSANFDDEADAERTIGGQNGIGAKACNIYSTRFEVTEFRVDLRTCWLFNRNLLR
jgi:DNA topoisomerase-2